MTKYGVTINDDLAIRKVLRHSKALLLDFDGPVCSMFAGISAHRVADQLRNEIIQDYPETMPTEVARSDDPFQVLRYAASIGVSEGDHVEAVLQAIEVDAVATAQPTLNSHQLIHRWHASGRRIAIVSNNSKRAIQAYVKLYNLSKEIDTISARTSSNIALLKPNSFLVARAAKQLGIAPLDCVMIGDSASDVTAAQGANSKIIAYANKKYKKQALIACKPDVVITSLDFILPAVMALNLK